MYTRHLTQHTLSGGFDHTQISTFFFPPSFWYLLEHKTLQHKAKEMPPQKSHDSRRKNKKDRKLKTALQTGPDPSPRPPRNKTPAGRRRRDIKVIAFLFPTCPFPSLPETCREFYITKLNSLSIKEWPNRDRPSLQDQTQQYTYINWTLL